MDEKQRNVLLTEEGYEAAEDVLQVGAEGARVAVGRVGVGRHTFIVAHIQRSFQQAGS